MLKQLKIEMEKYRIGIATIYQGRKEEGIVLDTGGLTISSNGQVNNTFGTGSQ